MNASQPTAADPLPADTLGPLRPRKPKPAAVAYENTTVIRTWLSDGLRRPVPIWHAAGVISSKGNLSRVEVLNRLLAGERLETNVAAYQLPQ